MDMLAVPDFSAGAMENWGLVTYRTVMLLVDPNNTSSLTQQRVAYVVAHELAHQWFGNLVTMEWWDELWLNEGFATWVGWYAVDHFFPSWQVWSQFVNNELGKALELDALQSSHPIQELVSFECYPLG
ncbi:arginine/alanine aminopeptidase [Coelomomyces lativittatus]|nr:arginine/alanine aminopeptidase [Coelomomyces lativittatus]